jgi:hypothetical protein
MVVELLHGLDSDVVYISSAMTYTLVVLLAALLAKGAATGREGVLRSLMAAGIMLAPSLGLATYALIAMVWHKNLLAGQRPPIPPPTATCAEGSTTYLNS